VKFTLFLGNRVGYEALRVLLKDKVEINAVFVEQEHEHEIEKYFNQIKHLCYDHSIPFYTNLKTEAIYNEVIKSIPDIIMCFGYRRYIPPKIYKLAKLCSVGTHFAPLPRYRGFAPVNWAIINGESETAVSMFHLGEGIDDGDIIAQRSVPIGEDETINEVLDKCIEQFKIMLSKEIKNFSKNIVKRIPQKHQEATYTCARNPEDGYIDWSMKTRDIYNMIRALTYPFPGAFSYLEDEKLIIWDAKPVEIGTYVGRIPGRVVKIVKGEGVYVLTGDGALLVKNVQLGNGNAVPAETIIKSLRIKLK
jgi:methionyl-tRNA formyltransferase